MKRMKSWRVLGLAGFLALAAMQGNLANAQVGNYTDATRVTRNTIKDNCGFGRYTVDASSDKATGNVSVSASVTEDALVGGDASPNVSVVGAVAVPNGGSRRKDGCGEIEASATGTITQNFLQVVGGVGTTKTITIDWSNLNVSTPSAREFSLAQYGAPNWNFTSSAVGSVRVDYAVWYYPCDQDFTGIDQSRFCPPTVTQTGYQNIVEGSGLTSSFSSTAFATNADVGTIVVTTSLSGTAYAQAKGSASAVASGTVASVNMI